MAPDGSAGSAFTAPVEIQPARPTTTTGEQARELAAKLGMWMPEPRSERQATLQLLELEIASSAAHVAAATHRMLTALRTFDEMTGWAEQGASSCVHWLSWRIGMSPGIAREKLRVARALGRLPQIDEALRSAQISYSKARALTRVATPENEGALLGAAASATAMELERVCRKFRGIALEEIEKRPRALAEERWVRFRQDDDTGLIRVTAQLPPAEAAVFKLAMGVAGAVVRKRAAALLRAAAKGDASGAAGASRTTAGDERDGAFDDRESAPDAPGAALDDREAVCGTALPLAAFTSPDGARSLTQAARELLFGDEPAGAADAARRSGARGGGWFRTAELEQLSTFSRADSLLAVCESFLERASLAERRLPRYEVVVQVQRDALAGTTQEPALLDDGTAVSAETARRLSCDCAVVHVETDAAGSPLDVGRRSRSIPSAIARALKLRDKTCRFPGCTQDAWLDAHHIRHWARGGATRLSNLVRLCARHHWFVHEGGGSMRAEGDRLLFFDPRGRPIENAPPLLHGGDPSAELLEWLREHGPGDGIALPLPIAFGDPADWSSIIQGWAAATYGAAVLHGDRSGVVPRLPLPDGKPPDQAQGRPS